MTGETSSEMSHEGVIHHSWAIGGKEVGVPQPLLPDSRIFSSCFFFPGRPFVRSPQAGWEPGSIMPMGAVHFGGGIHLNFTMVHLDTTASLPYPFTGHSLALPWFFCVAFWGGHQDTHTLGSLPLSPCPLRRDGQSPWSIVNSSWQAHGPAGILAWVLACEQSGGQKWVRVALRRVHSRATLVSCCC